MRILLTLGLACFTLTALGAKQSNKPDVKLVVTMDIAAPRATADPGDPHPEPVGAPFADS